MGCDLRGDGSLGWGGGGCLDWHCLNCDLGGFGGWAVISLAAMLGAWGGGVVWTGGLSGLLFARCQVSNG